MKLDNVMKLHHFVDILTGIRMCIILPLEYLGQRKSLSDPRPQTTSSKGDATTPKGASWDKTLWDS